MPLDWSLFVLIIAMMGIPYAWLIAGAVSHAYFVQKLQYQKELMGECADGQQTGWEIKGGA